MKEKPILVATEDLSTGTHIVAWRGRLGRSPFGTRWVKRYFIEIEEENEYGDTFLNSCQVVGKKKPTYMVKRGTLAIRPNDVEALAQMFDKIRAHARKHPQLKRLYLRRKWEAEYGKEKEKRAKD